jgi:hypothetical protein
MQIATISDYVPSQLRSELLAQSGNSGTVPGFVVNAPELSVQSPSLSAAIDDLRAKNGLSGPPCLVVPPHETSAIFACKDELDLLHSVADLIADQVRPHLKAGVDAIWLVYRAFSLREEWRQSNRNTTACLLKLAGIGLGVAGLAGHVYPEMKLPDSWSNGLNFIVKAGNTLAEGKTVAINELVLSSDKLLEIPLKIIKLAGISLDSAPPVLGQTPIPGVLVSPIMPSWHGREKSSST